MDDDDDDVAQKQTKKLKQLINEKSLRWLCTQTVEQDNTCQQPLAHDTAFYLSLSERLAFFRST